MLFWNKTKRAALLVGAIALAILIGTGAVTAAQNHLGPFSSANSPASHSQSSLKGDSTAEPTGEPTDQPKSGEDENENDQDLAGTIKSVDTTGQTFVLAPDDGSAAVTIAFDSKTNIDNEDGNNGSNPLVAGVHLTVEVVKRPDGSLYAAEISVGSDGHGDGENGSGGKDGSDNDDGSNGGSGSGSSDGD